MNSADTSTALETEVEAAKIQNAYSYVRLSSKKQLTGAGIDRQTQKAEQICREKGWTLSKKTFQDLGVSAFTGKNLLKGDLALFIRLASEGKLEPNPVLIVEAFDRFSRQDINESESAFLDLLRAGVAVHIAFTGRTLTRASANELSARFEILLGLKTAYEFSANLSRRVKNAKRRKVAAIAAGKTVNVSEMAPSWVDWNAKTQMHELNEKADFVRTIFNRYLAGDSIVSIAKGFNKLKQPAFRGGIWQTASIRYILGCRAVTGEFKRQPGVFPSVVSSTDFDRAQVLLDKNKGRRGKPAGLINLFRGMVHCTGCGYRITMSRNRKRNYAYYRCTQPIRGACANKFLCRSDLLEEEFFVHVLRTHPDEVIATARDDARTALEALRIEKQAAEKKRSLLLDLCDRFTGAELSKKYAEADELVNSLDLKIREAEGKMSASNSVPSAFGRMNEIIAGDDFAKLEEYLVTIQKTLADREKREKLQQAIGEIVSRIDLNLLHFNVVVTFTTGKQVDYQMLTP